MRYTYVPYFQIVPAHRRGQAGGDTLRARLEHEETGPEAWNWKNDDLLTNCRERLIADR
jgi:hypothetical protein